MPIITKEADIVILVESGAITAIYHKGKKAPNVYIVDEDEAAVGEDAVFEAYMAPFERMDPEIRDVLEAEGIRAQ